MAKNPDNALRPTNSPNTVYAITDEAIETIRKYGSIISKIEITNTCGFICLTKTLKGVRFVLYRNLQYFHL